MKFRLKTTLCMVCLVSLLFGAGSCALISFSFQNALEREQAAARSAYALLVRTLQLVETVEVWSQPQDVVQVLQQLSAQGNKSWSALSLETEQEFLSQGSISDGFLDLREQVDETHYAQSAFSYGGKQYLQLAGQLEIQGEPLILNVAYDISSIYQTRQQQQQAHGKIFAILFVVCAGLSYSIAWFLTRPLDKLSQTAQALPAAAEYRPRTSWGRWPGNLTPWPPARRPILPRSRPPWRDRTASSGALPTSSKPR